MVRAACRRVSLRVHPDKHCSDHESAACVAALHAQRTVIEARDILLDEDLRSALAGRVRANAVVASDIVLVAMIRAMIIMLLFIGGIIEAADLCRRVASSTTIVAWLSRRSDAVVGAAQQRASRATWLVGEAVHAGQFSTAPRL